MSRRPLLGSLLGEQKHRDRQMSYALANSARHKDRRWPLVLRFHKGSIHPEVVFPVLLSASWAALVVWFNSYVNDDFKLPASIIPSLSIVVGLELVFRNQTAYNRFWSGRLHFNTIVTAVRCISRMLLVAVPAPELPQGHFYGGATSRAGSIHEQDLNADDAQPVLSKQHEAKTIETVKILVAMLYSVKNHLRADWGIALSPGTGFTDTDGQHVDTPEYKDLLPSGLRGYEHLGLGLTLQLSSYIEKFINIGLQQNWFHPPGCTQMQNQLNNFVNAYGNMEVIRLAPTPVAHLIHSKQILAIFCSILPFAMVSEVGWWSVPLIAFVTFALYGIEAIAHWHEDPFGDDKIDINMDAIVEDTRREVFVMLSAWQHQGPGGNGVFAATGSGGFTTPRPGEIFA